MSTIDLGAVFLDGESEEHPYLSPFFEYSPVQCTDGQKSNVFTLAAGEKTKVFSLGDVCCEQDGCILAVTLNLKHVTPGRRVAVGVLLEEELEDGGALCRGVRTITVPAHQNAALSDIPLDNILFVLPCGEIDKSAPAQDSRRFRVSVVSHYMDPALGRPAERRFDHE